MNNSEKDKNKLDYEKYFNPNISPSPPVVKTEKSFLDKKSLKEENLLFKGPLSDIDSWIKHEEFRLKKVNEDSERELREDNAKKAFIFSSSWAFLIAVVIMCKSFFSEKFIMSENEYIATIGTLSITILTYYLVVIRSLFSKK